MLNSYLRLAVRNLARNKVYSFINIAGMALGMASCILILLWVRHEMSFDRFHEAGDRLFVVCTKHMYGTEEMLSTGTPPAVARALREEFPEILNSTRTRTPIQLAARSGDLVFNENVTRVDPGFLEMFSFPMLAGDAHTALSQPMSMVLTESMAAKYFGEEDPLGEVLVFDSRYDFTITGVVADVPENSTLQFDFLTPMEFDTQFFGADLETWDNCSFSTFVQLAEGTDWRDLETRLAGRVKRGDPESIITLFLFSFEDLHLHSVRGSGGRIERVNSFTLIAAIVLLIACINFMNLTTARAGGRAKEVGVRKVVGASGRDLVAQFYCESLVQAMAAAFLASVLVELILPWLNTLIGVELRFNLFGSPSLLLGVLGITLLTGLVAGSYPALFLSSFRPARVLKSVITSGARGLWFRRALVVFQFSLSIGLIIATGVVYRQHLHLRDMSTGLDTEHVVCQQLTEELHGKFQVLKRELESDPSFRHVSWSSNHPASVYWNGNGWRWQGKGPDVDPFVTYLGVDYDWLETLDIALAEGEFFSPELGEAAAHKVLVNQVFASLLGPGSAMGTTLHHEDRTFTVLGVVEDFHFTPVYRDVGPLVVFFRPEFRTRGYLLAKLETGCLQDGVARLEATWRQHAPDTPFEVHFLDEDFDRLYRDERQMGDVLRAFAVLAVLISGLGLFGLASFMAEQRTKEIGIRKVMGASAASIVLLLTREFTRWVLFANLVAWPLAYFIMRRWLERFAFQTALGPGIFLGAAAGALAVALLTVSVQAIRAASTNPARALRYE